MWEVWFHSQIVSSNVQLPRVLLIRSLTDFYKPRIDFLCYRYVQRRISGRSKGISTLMMGRPWLGQAVRHKKLEKMYIYFLMSIKCNLGPRHIKKYLDFLLQYYVQEIPTLYRWTERIFFWFGSKWYCFTFDLMWQSLT